MPHPFSSFAVLAATAAALALAAAPAGASDGHAAKLAPPLIRESFTPMPCSGSPGKRSTLQEEGCAEQQILHSDKQIDSLNQKIFNALHTTSARRDLIAGHRAWLAYRKSYCLSVSDVFQGGTLAGVVDADCVATVNGQHVSNLKMFLKDLTSHA
ncbi:MAG TPA: lysozyme inhibitor LprI family protein [Solirubrobacteraceae bacterium]